jgi:hypothetical protein
MAERFTTKVTKIQKTQRELLFSCFVLFVFLVSFVVNSSVIRNLRTLSRARGSPEKISSSDTGHRPERLNKLRIVDVMPVFLLLYRSHDEIDQLTARRPAAQQSLDVVFDR